MEHIRAEKPQDVEQISEIHRIAFGSDAEPEPVLAIRRSEGFYPELSLVAESDGRLVGHILFSGISIQSGAHTYPALSLAPMAVVPEYQNRGIGTALVRRGQEECRRLRHRIVIVIGHPEYYPRFGFEPAGSRGLSLEFEVPDEAFMVLELEEGVLNTISGVVKYPEAFNSAT